MPKGIRTTGIALTASIVLYLLALTQDVMPGWPGYGVLLIGWLTVGSSVANTTWLANSALFAAWLLMLTRERKMALLCAGGAVVTAGVFFLCRFVVVDEGGGARPIGAFRLAHWLWFASTLCTFMAAYWTPSSPARR